MAAAVEVLFEGVLAIGRNPSSNKDWTQRLFVLKLHKEAGTVVLDYYKDRNKRWQKQDPVGMIPLWPSFKLSLAHECGYKFPLKLTANSQTYYLSANTFPLMNAWFHHIQTTRVLGRTRKGHFEFKVQAKFSDSTELIQAIGSCLVALTGDNEVICAALPGRQVLGVWPYDSLRRYWCSEGLFGFEAGRRSPRGEGRFEFLTEKNEEIYRTLEQCIIKAKQGDARPPLPVPNSPAESDTPPVSTSSSDEETPALPARLPLKTQSVRVAPTGATPPHLKRVHSHTGVRKWLHQACDSQGDSHKHSPIKKEPSPVSGDDTYAHTVHAYPPPFQRTSPDQTSSGQTYQRLHGQTTTRQPSLHFEVSNLPEADMQTYDVAYQPDPTRQTQAIPSDGQYAVLGMPDPSRIVRDQTSTAGASRLAESPASLVPGPSLTNEPISDEHLTPNPLYGSQDDLLKALDKLQATPPLPVRSREERGLDLTDTGLEELMISPAYEHHQLGEEPAQPDVSSPSRDDASAEDDPSTSDSPSEKKTKPYSKVSKKPAEEEEACGSGGESPPPIPARLYSMDSSGSDPPATTPP